MTAKPFQLISVLLFLLPRHVASFAPRGPLDPFATVRQHYMLPDNPGHSISTTAASFIISAVPVFDGSTITNPVVTSSSYWSTLQSQLVSLLIGQLVGIVVFVIVASTAAQQLPEILEQLGDFVALNIFRENEDSYRKLKVPPPSNTQQGQQREINLDLTKLALCIAIDLLGSINELIPIYGEVADVLYAPLAAYLLREAFGGSNVSFAIEFAEEILPFTDILPFASVCWLVDTFGAESSAARILQLGNYKPNTVRNNIAAQERSELSDRSKNDQVIDVEVDGKDN